MAHIHDCMRCGMDFECLHKDKCKAHYHVLPVIWVEGIFVNHFPPHPNWDEIRALIDRRIQQNELRKQAETPCWKDIRVSWRGGNKEVWKCRKQVNHTGPCSEHNDCGHMNADGSTCGFANDHAGPHAGEEQ